jgi:hypothetical protein
MGWDTADAERGVAVHLLQEALAHQRQREAEALPLAHSWLDGWYGQSLPDNGPQPQGHHEMQQEAY